MLISGVEHPQVKDITGKRFGLVVVKEVSHIDSKYKVWWVVFCDCGKNFISRSNNLIRGQVKSCGCSKRKGGGERGFNQLYAKYRWRAEQLKIPFTLTKEEFRELVTSPCYYCGVLPAQKVYLDGVRGYTKEYIDYCQFIYNGIDQIEHSRGYTRLNCFPCCKVCNFAKSTKTLDEFIRWVIRMYRNLDSKGLIKELEL